MFFFNWYIQKIHETLDIVSFYSNEGMMLFYSVLFQG